MARAAVVVNHQDLPKNSGRDEVKSSGHPADKESPLPASPTINELIEARERADAGLRLAMPQLAERLGVGEDHPEPEPIAAEAFERTGSDLLDIRAALVVAGARFPLKGHVAIHQALNGLVNGVDDLAALLSERSPS
jgi:hypothetical protein